MKRTVPTKLRVPEIETRLILRPHLMRLLDEGLRRKLTLVSAPAGYGKTTSVATWIRALGDRSSQPPHPEIQPPVSTAWYSLDPEDDDLSTFFTRFTAAIEVALPGALRAVATGLDLEAMPAEQYTNALAEACLKLPHPVVVVLDDYHLIAQPGIHAVLLHLIQYASDKLHLVIVTRHDPPLRIARLRAQNQVAEVRSANLRLTEQETEEFLKIRLAQRQPAELVATLQARTEGWLAGLQLAATAIRGLEDLAEFASDLQRHDSLYVMDYLVDEVLSLQGEQVQAFMLKTALLVRFNVELAAQVTQCDVATCRRILDELRRQNLFLVVLDDEQGWFRYHRQFQAMLVDRARAMLSPAAIDAMRSDAARWLADHGWIDEALTEYVAHRQWEQAADLVEADRQRLQNAEEWHQLWRRISSLPEDVVAQRPDLLVAQAWILQVHDRLATIPSLLDQAEALSWASAAIPHLTPADQLQGEILALQGSWIFPRTPAEQRLDCLHKALSLLPARECGWVRGFAWIQLAYIMVSQGQRDVAYRRLMQEIETAGPGQDVYLTRLHHALATIAYRDGTLNELQEIGLRYRQLATMNNLTMAKAWADFAVGWVHYQRCEPTLAMEALLPVFDQPYRVHMETMILALVALVPVAAELGRGEEARRLLEHASRIALERKNIAAADELSALVALAALLRQDRQKAMAWAEGFIQAGFQSAGAKRRDPDVSSQVPVFARIALASGRAGYVQLALEFLQNYVNLYQVRGNKSHVVNGAVLLACCLWRNSQPVQALRTMQLAVDIGWPRGFRCPFFEQGREVAPMLYAMIQRGMSAEAASTLLAEYGTWSARSKGFLTIDDITAQDAIVPLSEREMEVLDLLAQRLTNKEIARRLDISPLTVRNHTSSIYSKLQVASRKQAVAQAELLGLLSPVSHP